MATYSIQELQTLKRKAVDFIEGEDHTQCFWLYRNKSEGYFKDILINNNGIMTTVEKDRGGDPKNPINGALKGLFFMARNENLQPPPNSPFGPVRFQVPARELLSRTPNIYFADFYCLQGNTHYVTLVFTSPSTSADLFCRNRLPSLTPYNKQDNPFLYLKNGIWYVSRADFFQVEVFFTQDIRVFSIPPGVSNAAEENRDILNASLLAISGAQMKTVPTIGRGHSTPRGLPKDSTCSICNLPPIAETATTNIFARPSRNIFNRRQQPQRVRYNPYRRK